jgi:tetratricopeptide (TPR) repeat protein
MLQTVREYAADALDQTEEAGAAREAHAMFFLRLIAASGDGLRSSSQTAWMSRLEIDNDNLNVALRWCLDRGDVDHVAEAGWTVWLYWWINAHLQEGRDLMAEARSIGGLSALGQAKVDAVEGVMAFWQTDYSAAIPMMGSALEGMRANDFPAGVALCQLPLGFVDAAMGNVEDAQTRYEESIAFFKQSGDEWGTAISLNAYSWMCLGADLDPGEHVFTEGVELSHRMGTQFEYGMALRNLGGYRARKGEVVEAKELLEKALRLLRHTSIRGGATYTIDAIAEIATDEGALELAAKLFAATDGMREATGSSIIPMFAARFKRFVDRLRAELGEERFSSAWAAGRDFDISTASELALDWVSGRVVSIGETAPIG